MHQLQTYDLVRVPFSGLKKQTVKVGLTRLTTSWGCRASYQSQRSCHIVRRLDVVYLCMIPHLLRLIRVDRSILKLRPYLRHQNFDFFRFPFQSSGQKTNRKTLETFQMCDQLKLGGLLQGFMLGPGIRWRLEYELDNVFETSLRKPSPELIMVRYGSVVFICSFTNDFGPVAQAIVFAQGAVVRVEPRVQLL